VNHGVAQQAIPAIPVSPDSDEENGRALIRRIAAGDRDALAALCARYQTAVFYYLVRLLGDRALAEEVFQDTLVAVWRSAATFEGRSSVQTWLVGIARRQAHNSTRRRVLPRADVAELEVLPSADPEPEDVALAGARREELAAAMARLTHAHREVLVLTFVHGLSYPEMARLVEVPEGTIKSRLSNAKRALRALLEEEEAMR
jgi:RNA polymerase sigma-70 factor (ECF subfamily)